jgi:hypothetical protein
MICHVAAQPAILHVQTATPEGDTESKTAQAKQP